MCVMKQFYPGALAAPERNNHPIGVSFIVKEPMDLEFSFRINKALLSYVLEFKAFCIFRTLSKSLFQKLLFYLFELDRLKPPKLTVDFNCHNTIRVYSPANIVITNAKKRQDAKTIKFSTSCQRTP